MKAIKIAQRFLRSFGYEVVPYPPTDWVRTREILREVLNKLSIDCIFDVGANSGDFGDVLRDVGYEGWIISFEPVQAVFDQLVVHAASRPPWRAFQYALGTTNGRAAINIAEASELNSFLTPLGPSKTLPLNRATGQETVEVRRLDSIFDECIAGIDVSRFFLKMDTQGYDLEVLRGSEGVIEKFIGAQTEISFVPIYEGMPDHLESLKEFQDRGFHVVDFVPVTRVAGGLLMMEMDAILARPAEQA